MSEVKMPHYRNDPITNALTAPELKLKRPKIDYPRTLFAVFLFLSGTLFLSMVVSCLELFFAKKQAEDIAVLKTIFQLWPLLTLIFGMVMSRVWLIWLIRVYQHYAKPETRLRCCYTPSCSEYAILAIRKYGTIIGCTKAYKRLLRCNPPGGIDYP